jgi:GxxExxY protein
MALQHEENTEKIIGAFFTVYQTLGYGFLEKVYANALTAELNRMGLKVVQEARISVYYRGKIVGEYFADLVVADKVIVERKAVKELAIEHEAQLLDYLRATPYEVGLLLNFGPKSEYRRKAFSNQNKQSATWIE